VKSSGARAVASGFCGALLLLCASTVERDAIAAIESGVVSNGKIAYSDSSQIWSTINRNGWNRRHLAGCKTGSCVVSAYAWSPAGKRLAFLRGIRGGRFRREQLSLFVVRADGKRERRLDGCGKPKWTSCGDFFGSRISWAPDGSRVVVTRGGSLYTFNVDRKGFRRLTSCGRLASCFDKHPAWAPDGSTILFARLDGPRSQSIYSVKPDGTGLTRLTDPRDQTGNPVWSPDGRRIAFDAWDETESRIYVMRPDGSDPTLLKAGPPASGPGVPAWSPDGARIVFVSTPGTPGAYVAEIWTINPDGTQPMRLYRSDCCLSAWGRPTWSPDGRYIAFASGLGTPDMSGLYVVKTDGTGLRKLVAGLVAGGMEPAWQPIR
jgi:Tol biopolymer transport system component